MTDDDTGDGRPLAQAWAALQVSVDGIGKTMHVDRIEREQRQPIRAPLVKAGTVPATGPLVLDLGVPAMGRRWTLRNLSVSDAADVTTAVTGKANLYVGSPLAYGPVGWRDTLAALPATALYDDGQVVVIPSDHLVVVITGATAGQVLMARAEVDDYPYQLGRPVQPL